MFEKNVTKNVFKKHFKFECFQFSINFKFCNIIILRARPIVQKIFTFKKRIKNQTIIHEKKILKYSQIISKIYS